LAAIVEAARAAQVTGSCDEIEGKFGYSFALAWMACGGDFEL